MFILTQFSFAYNPAFYFNMGKKLWRHRSFSSTCYSVIIGNILITIIIFARYHLLVASNSTFMTDFYVLRCNSDLSNLNEHYYYLISPASVIWQINANCSPFHSLNVLFSHQARTVQTNLLGLLSNFPKNYFKAGTIRLLFLSPHVFTAVEFNSNYFGILF